MMDQPSQTPISAEQRLLALPPKTAQPLIQLLRIGQIAEDVLNVLLDAGEAATDRTRLLGFAAGYLHMRAAGIPVHDVIKMARNQNRRINLAWSPSRWTDEHHRLSRAEALQRLTADNITYDVSTYQQLLPANFPGYLIKTSRRLGMEGLRQRHCVAAYHDNILRGQCAIAAVFVDHQRWTVQLTPTQNPDNPLRITQIKTRYNGTPTSETRTAIHAILGIELPKATPQQTAPEQQYLYLDNLRRILPVLRQNGIAHIIVSFDGSGDSGSIEDIAFEPADRLQNPGNIQTEHLVTESILDDGIWLSRVSIQQTTLEEAIRTLTDDYLSEVDVNWYDNDGGFGSLEIDVGQGTVSLEVNCRYTESTTEHHSERDIATGQEL